MDWMCNRREKKEVKGNSKDFNLSNRHNGVAFNEIALDICHS